MIEKEKSNYNGNARLFLRSPIPPSVNHYLSYRTVIKNNKAIGMSYKTKEAKQYQREFMDYVISEVKKQQWNPPANKLQHFYVDAVFYFKRTDQDANNYFKVLLDAITDTGLLWKDDNVVCERVQGIYYDTLNPHIDLCIYPTDYIGVFEDASQLEEFESGCVACKRYKRNCSLLKSAKEGRIQAEVHDGVCEKRVEAGNVD